MMQVSYMLGFCKYNSVALPRTLAKLTGSRRSKKVHATGEGSLHFPVADGHSHAQNLQTKPGINANTTACHLIIHLASGLVANSTAGNKLETQV